LQKDPEIKEYLDDFYNRWSSLENEQFYWFYKSYYYFNLSTTYFTLHLIWYINYILYFL
jgi:hypothetical protein